MKLYTIQHDHKAARPWHSTTWAVWAILALHITIYESIVRSYKAIWVLFNMKDNYIRPDNSVGFYLMNPKARVTKCNGEMYDFDACQFRMIAIGFRLKSQPMSYPVSRYISHVSLAYRSILMKCATWIGHEIGEYQDICPYFWNVRYSYEVFDPLLGVYQASIVISST